MKALLILLLSTVLLTAQDNVSIGLYQDGRLLFIGDDHGNDAGTLDIKVDVGLQGHQRKWSYYEMRVQFEYADLSGGKYVSWLVMGGHVFNKLIVKNFEIGMYPTIGMIHRFKTSYGTYGLTGDISYKMGRFKLSLLTQGIKRFELENQKFGMSVYGGVKYEF